jgi:hypothetical protein
MKRLLFLLLFWVFSSTIIYAQLPAGSIAPDFTVTDIDGAQHHLYELLDEGKTVYLDFFATWCGPCWNYHNTHALRDIWDQYGPDGTDEAYVIAIEGDPATNVPCIYGPSGCNNTTQGNWTLDTPYPIADDAGVRGAYSVGYYPTIYMVCPGTKKVYETGQLNKTGLWAKRTQFCTLVASVTLASVKNVVCYSLSTGKITLTPATGAVGPYSYHWSNGANTTTPILNNIPAGTYACTVTPTQGSTGTISGIQVEGPPSAISVALIESVAPGCNGVPGSMLIEAGGGWPGGYNYVWNNGQQSNELINVSAGNYTVTVTDDEGCTKTQSFALTPAPPMIASIVATTPITCGQPNITIDASNSSQGNNISYTWFATNGGNIVSGGNTLNPVVNAAGNYTLQIFNSQTSCNVFGVTSVSTNTTPPTASAGPATAINCTQTTAVLQGSGSAGSAFTYLWTASNGGNIVSGAGTLTPTVNASGTYTLRVTNSENGCTKTATTTVTGNNTSLAATATGGTITCTSTSVALGVTSSSSNATYAWTGPNGFTSALQSPVVSTLGNYNVQVTDATGCSGAAMASVAANNTTPGASATGGAITCTNASVTLTGGSPTSNTNFTWTGPSGFTASTATANVTVSGDYLLVVTNPANGCTSSATTNIALNNTLPTASIASASNLNCNNAQVQLNATASSQGNGINYNWTTANGAIASGNNTLTPLVSAAGTYNLEVLNTQNGCTSTTAVTVVQSAPVIAAATATSVACNGNNNGSVSATSTGGSGTYNYLWSNGASTASVSSLSAGQYALVVTDGEGCTSTTTVEITQPAPLSANAVSTSQSANGVNDGTATANPNGGTSSYTYLWNNAATAPSITNLAPGSYTVTVTDAYNCTAVQIVTVNAFNCALAATISSANATCFGSNNGTASVNLVGANEPVAYNWSNGANTSAVSNLAAGNYTVSIMDGNNCPAQLNLEITEPTALQPNTTTTNETASSANDGTASAAPVGGTGTYTYTWSNGATTAAIVGLAPGTYTVTVGDQNGCQSTRSVTVNSFDCAISTQFSSVNVNCFGQNSGNATVTLAGGTAPFTYLWNNGGTTATISGLTAGTYNVQVTDNNGCQTQSSITITQPTALQVNINGVTNTICPNDPAGAIQITTAGGTSGYMYNWSNGATSEDLTGVPAGNYSLVVTDANGCSQTVAATVTNSDTQAPSIASTSTTLALNADGTITLTPAMLNIQAADNCGSVTVTIPNTTFACTALGEHLVIATATDAAGNTATTVVTVNIIDNIAPVLTCPASITRCSNDNTVEYPAPFASDNCLSGGTWNLVEGLPSNAVFPVGAVTTQTYSFTDLGGNTGLCSFDVIINSAAVLQFVSTAATNNNANGTIDLTVTGGLSPYTYLWSNGATTQDLTGLLAGTYTVNILDANGCKSTSTITVTNVVSAFEPAWLSGVSIRPNPTTGFARIVFGQLPDETIHIQVLDASGRVLMTSISEGSLKADLDCSQLPEGMYFIQMRTNHVSSVRRLAVQR